MKQVSKSEAKRYFEQRKSGKWISERPQLLGKLPTSLITAFYAIPDAKDFRYVSLNANYFESGKLAVIDDIRFTFASIAGVLSIQCETRFGWWRGSDDNFHVDGHRTEPQAVVVSVLGKGTEYAVGPCRTLDSMGLGVQFEIEDGTPVYNLQEGGVYRFGPNVIHREPLCLEPQNRLFLRTG